MIFVILFALTAALLNAISSVMQRRVAGHPKSKELFRKDFSKSMTTSKLWIAGFALEVLAFFAQAAALRNGSLVMVEPLLTVDLVFLMLLLHFRFGVATGVYEWCATAMICLGLSGLMLIASPQVGNQAFMANRWLETALPIVAAIALAIYIVRRSKSKNRRAAISGLAAGLSFALVAMLTKLTTQQLNLGIGALFTGWQVYALLVAGILSVIMTQNAYGAGPVAMSQPTMEVVEPLVSVFMGIILFGDRINLSAWAILLEICAGGVTATGILLLGRSDRLMIQDI